MAAEQENAMAQAILGAMYSEPQEGFQRDDKESYKWYKLAAEQGNAIAQYSLGAMYETGAGVYRDDKEAFKWYKLSAEQGDEDGQVNLGIFYATGKVVKKDKKEALRLFQLAAEKGSEDALNNIDVLSQEILPEKYEEALELQNQTTRKMPDIRDVKDSNPKSNIVSFTNKNKKS